MSDYSDWSQCEACGKMALLCDLDEEGLCLTCAAELDGGGDDMSDQADEDEPATTVEIFPYSQMGTCPYCGHQYVESYSGNTFGDEYADQHCFSCGADFAVERTPELEEPQRLCTECHGRGYLQFPNGDEVACPVCGGAGARDEEESEAEE